MSLSGVKRDAFIQFVTEVVTGLRFARDLPSDQMTVANEVMTIIASPNPEADDFEIEVSATIGRLLVYINRHAQAHADRLIAESPALKLHKDNHE